eukprot:364965-Chlamydomonas_euryale.AAC.32
MRKLCVYPHRTRAQTCLRLSATRIQVPCMIALSGARHRPVPLAQGTGQSLCHAPAFHMLPWLSPRHFSHSFRSTLLIWTSSKILGGLPQAASLAP